MKHIASFMIIFILLTTGAIAGERKPIKPANADKCPVCGMFVAKYPDFIAQILFKDGSYALFDGPKDMLKYYFNFAKYAQGKRAMDIDSLYVTDYYSLTPIDGFNAVYVLGSDVFGPMGRELIPFAKLSDAEEFKKDHKGTSILKFGDITITTITGLD
jgi:nitrous oxide reductase accessory protein NosL